MAHDLGSKTGVRPSLAKRHGFDRFSSKNSIMCMAHNNISPQHSHAEYRPNLYLVGPMGVGKSAVGRTLAQQLGLWFLDSDREIEHTSGRTIKEIFATDGEAAFRTMERAFIENGHPEQGCLVATGGGLIIPDGMMELVQSKGVVLCLFASVDTIIKRTSTTDKRPLLNVEDPAAKVRELLEKREPYYKKAGPGVCTENSTIAEISSRLARLYEREAVAWLEKRKLSSQPR